MHLPVGVRIPEEACLLAVSSLQVSMILEVELKVGYPTQRQNLAGSEFELLELRLILQQLHQLHYIFARAAIHLRLYDCSTFTVQFRSAGKAVQQDQLTHSHLLQVHEIHNQFLLEWIRKSHNRPSWQKPHHATRHAIEALILQAFELQGVA